MKFGVLVKKNQNKKVRMCGKRVENLGESSQRMPGFQSYPEFFQYNEAAQVQTSDLGGGGYGGVGIAEASILPWSTIPEVHGLGTNPVQFNAGAHARDQDHFLACMASSSSSPSTYQGFHRSALQLAYDHNSHENHRIGGARFFVGSDPLAHARPGSSSLGLQPDFGKMTAQEIMDAKALAASKSHSEAERRRRERINTHLATLRSLLPSTTKTDKASLLAEVIQHVKELKRQTLEIAEESPVPTEMDELIVDSEESCGDGKFVIRASLCCDDHSDLLPDLIKTLKALRLRTLKAEITTLGGRVKNVLLVTGEDDSNERSIGTSSTNPSINSIQDALKAVMERAVSGDSSSGNIKRQRTNISILDHRSI